MQSRCSQVPGSSGFVLLQTLWLLLLASVLASIVMALGLGNAREQAASTAVLRAEMAAESAVHRALHQILTQGPRSALAQGRGYRTVSMEIDGNQVDVKVCDASGLVDLNAADEQTLQRLLAALPVMNGNVTVAAIKAARPIGSYSALFALEGMTRETFDAMLPHVTLFARHAVPSEQYASDWLARTLQLKQVRQGVMSDSSSIAGRLLRIESSARTNAVTSRKLVAEILITGRRDHPFLIYEWNWQSR